MHLINLNSLAGVNTHAALFCHLRDAAESQGVDADTSAPPEMGLPCRDCLLSGVAIEPPS